MRDAQRLRVGRIDVQPNGLIDVGADLELQGGVPGHCQDVLGAADNDSRVGQGDDHTGRGGEADQGIRIDADGTQGGAADNQFSVDRALTAAYTFHLRPGLKWSDGTALTTLDFEYTFKRLFDPATASPYTDIVNAIKGSQEFLATKSQDPAELARLRDGVAVKATDDTTLIITLRAPQSFFLSTLFNGATAPVSRRVVEQYKDQAFDPAHYVGAGPFLLKSWTHNSMMELAPNPNYHGTLPKINLRLVMINDSTATLAAYKNNEIDTDGRVAPSPGDIAAIQSDPQLSKEVLRYTELATFYLVYNITSKPFDSPLVRQALNYAIDRQTLVTSVLAGQGQPETSVVPPGLLGHVEAAGPGYDLNKAKALLAQAGYPDGKGIPQDIQTSFSNTSFWPAILQFIQAQLKAVGVGIQLDPRDAKTYFSQRKASPPPLAQSGWSSDYPDPDDWYRIMFFGTSSQNFGHWHNAQYDQIVSQAATESDPAKRQAEYEQAAAIMATDPPALWWYYSQRIRLVKPWAHGTVPTPQDGGLPGKFFMKDVTLS